MAEFDLNLAVAFGTQSVLGTADPTIAALAGALDSSDGIVLGDAASGIAESGLSYSFIRSLREKAPVAGSFTAQPSDFLGEQIDGFTFAVPLKGCGATASGAPADGEYTPLAGVDALLRSAGLSGAAWASGVGWEYKPASAQIATAKIFDSGGAWVIKDLVANMTIEWTPGGIAVATFALAGVVDSYAAVAFPTLDFGSQASLSSPAVEQVAHNWGIGGAPRGFSAATTSISNETEDVPDSNAEGGKRTRQTGRTITHTATIYSDDGDPDFERTELVRTTAPTEPLIFTVGTPAGAAATINAIQMELTNPETRSIKPAKGGTSRQLEVELVAVDTAANGEFALRFV